MKVVVVRSHEQNFANQPLNESCLVSAHPLHGINTMLLETTEASGVTLWLQKAKSYQTGAGKGSKHMHYSGSFVGYLHWELLPVTILKQPQVCTFPFARFHRPFL